MTEKTSSPMHYFCVASYHPIGIKYHPLYEPNLIHPNQVGVESWVCYHLSNCSFINTFKLPINPDAICNGAIMHRPCSIQTTDSAHPINCKNKKHWTLNFYEANHYKTFAESSEKSTAQKKVQSITSHPNISKPWIYHCDNLQVHYECV